MRHSATGSEPLLQRLLGRSFFARKWNSSTNGFDRPSGEGRSTRKSAFQFDQLMGQIGLHAVGQFHLQRLQAVGQAVVIRHND